MLATRFEIGGGLTALFGVLALGGMLAGVRALRGPAVPEMTATAQPQRAAWGQAIVSGIVVTVIALLAIVAAIFLRWLAVPVVFVFYIIVSLAFQDGPRDVQP